MQPLAQSQQIAKRIWFHFWYYLHAGIEFDSTCGFGWYGDAGKTMAVVGNEAEKSHGNSQPISCVGFVTQRRRGCGHDCLR